MAALRVAIDAEDDEQLVRIVDHIWAEGGKRSALEVVTNLLKLARNPIVDPRKATFIEIAMMQYRSRLG